jgi:hypothetical protein
LSGEALDKFLKTRFAALEWWGPGITTTTKHVFRDILFTG